MEALLPLLIPSLVFFVVMMLAKQAMKAVIIMACMVGIVYFLEANGFSVIAQIRYFFDNVDFSLIMSELNKIFSF